MTIDDLYVGDSVEVAVKLWRPIVGTAAAIRITKRSSDDIVAARGWFPEREVEPYFLVHGNLIRVTATTQSLLATSTLARARTAAAVRHRRLSTSGPR